MEQSYRRCPFCAEHILAAAIVCKHCHRDLRQPTSPSLLRSIGRFLQPLAIALGIVSLGAVIAMVLLAVVP